MFAAGAPTYTIDLDSAGELRWAEVISRERTIARLLLSEAAAEFERVPELLRWIFAGLYKAFGGLYQGEIRAWADGLDASVGTLTILNCAYELSHLRWPKVFGCTAGVRWIEGLGMVHVRNLDWPLAGMGRATRLFRFRRGPREFVSVGVPGQVGVLSGMLPKAYSVTINWAPPAAFPTFDFGPGFLLRDTLETCDTFEAAVRVLTQTHLSTSVFFTVCGVEKDQACVIERTQREAATRRITGSALTQANHFAAEQFAKHNADLSTVEQGEEQFTLEASSHRAEALTEALANTHAPCSLDRASQVLDTPAVLNNLTCQQMAFCARTGDVKVGWRLDAIGCSGP
jgi:predicted choloylglycine hydrolase